MKTIPNCYYNKEITNLVRLAIEDGYQSYTAMPEIEQERISAKCIEVLGNDAYECIINSDDLSNTLHHLKQFLLTGKKEYAFDLAETMSINATRFFSEVMDGLFSEMVDDNQYEIYKLIGLKPSVDHINGEMTWA